MKKVLTSIILVILLSVNLSANDLQSLTPESLADETLTYVYEEHYYDGIGESRLNITKTERGYLLEWLGITDVTEVHTDFNFNTMRMRMTDKDTDITAIREGDKLLVKGIDEGKKIDKTLKIDSQYWYQLMPASLSEFMKSKDTERAFSMFDPYNIQVMDMKIEKGKIEKVSLGGIEYEAVKMKMRMQGFLSMFWKSEILYSKDSRLQVRYEGVNVIPKLYNAVILLDRIELK